MKILDKKDQLRSKLDDTDNAIDFADTKQKRARKRKERKENWGILSFIADEQWLLRFNYERELNALHLLLEYREQLMIRLNNTPPYC